MNQTNPKTKSKAKMKQTTKSENRRVKREADLLIHRAVNAYRKPPDTSDFLYWNK